MDTRMNKGPAGVTAGKPAEVADALDRERRFDKLGATLSTLRIFLLLSVQCYLLLGFSLIFVRPPSGAFYIAVIVLAINSLLFAGCLARFFHIRNQMLRLSVPGETGKPGQTS